MTEQVGDAATQQAHRDDPEGYMNVRLRAIALDAAGKSAAVENAKMSVQLEGAKHGAIAAAKAAVPAQTKSPSETINFKDAGPHLREQIAAQAGLDASADSEMDAADKIKPHLTPPTPPTPGKKPPVQ